VLALARLGGPGAWLGGGAGVAYAGVADEVIALTLRSIPEMPNGIVVDELPDVTPGSWCALDRRGLEWHGGSLPLEGAAIYDPLMPRVDNGPWLLERLEAIGSAFESPADAGSPEAARLLADAIRGDDTARAAAAADALVGRGTGLTPEGDDLLAATAAVAHSCGVRSAWIEALLPRGLQARTTALSASLLHHAVNGRAVAPYADLFDRNSETWRGSLLTLAGLGHSTGRAYLTAAYTFVTEWINRREGVDR
jgi:hypothetical protein